VAALPASPPAKSKRHNDFAWAMGFTLLLAVYYVALAISSAGWIRGLLPAEPLALLLVGWFVALPVGCMGIAATVMAWFTRQGDRRLLAIAFLVNAPSVVFLAYAGIHHYFLTS
jgi:hypothetical protein